MTQERKYRNKRIIEKFKLGYTQGDLSRAYGLTRARVSAIIKYYEKKKSVNSYPQEKLDKVK